MKKTINFTDFCDEFNGSQYENNFTYEGKEILFNFLENYEDDTGEQIELDIVALCCDYSESNYKDIINNYSDIKEDSTFEEVIEYLDYNSLVLGYYDETIIYQIF